MADEYSGGMKDMDSEERKKKLKENVTECLNIIARQKLTKDQIRQISEEGLMFFRGGAEDFLKINYELNFPLIITSAGVGDVIKQAFALILKKKDMCCENIEPFKVISNIGDYENDKLVAFNQDTIHPANKHEHIITSETFEDKKNSEEGKSVRHNILLMGDVTDDLDMVENVDYENLIKLGYYNDSLEDGDGDKLNNFKDSFDIIITNDGNLWPATCILQFLTGKEISEDMISDKSFTDMLKEIRDSK